MIIDIALTNKYDKLIEKALEINPDEYDFFVYSSIQLANYIKENFSEKEQYVVEHRYCEEKETYNKMAADLNVSSSRMQQVDKKLLRKTRYFFIMTNTKMRQDDILKFLPSLDYFVRKSLIEKHNNILDNSLKEDFVETYIYLVSEKIKETIEELKQTNPEEVDLSTIKIRELELSVPTYYALLRSDITNLQQLKDKINNGEFKQTKYIGKKRMDEAIRKLEEFDEKFKVENLTARLKDNLQLVQQKLIVVNSLK